jgi:membrane protein YdbS with pleckstrin-like domain
MIYAVLRYFDDTIKISSLPLWVQQWMPSFVFLIGLIGALALRADAGPAWSTGILTLILCAMGVVAILVLEPKYAYDQTTSPVSLDDKGVRNIIMWESITFGVTAFVVLIVGIFGPK